MELLEKLEHKIQHLLKRLQELEAENSELKAQLTHERRAKEKVSQGLDRLLQKIQEIDIT